MKLSVRAVSLAAVMALAAGCSSEHGFLGTDYRARGDITVGIAGTTGTLATSATNPYETSAGGFTIGLNETNFTGSFNVKITSWHNGFDEPCYVVHKQSGTLFTFSADNANAPSAPTTQPNPCNVAAGDIEQAEIDDGIGNSTYFYYELV